MSITGNVLLGLIYILPGILFVFGLTRFFSTKVPSPFDGQISTGIALAVPAAVLMHTIGIGVAYACSYWGTPKPDISQALTLLLSDSRSKAMGDAITNSAKHWLAIAAYFLPLFLFSFTSGKLANKVWKPKRRADWFDLLSHEADMLWLTTDMQMGGVTYLFAGMLHDFKLTPEGELDRVVLLGAVRRTMKRPSSEEMQSGDENYRDGGWIPIPGEYVVLKMNSSNTINVDYWYLESETPDEAPDNEGASEEPIALRD